MGPEADFLAKYAPYYIPLLSAVILIIFTKNYLFRGMVSTDIHEKQLERERDFVAATKEAAGHLEEISRQLESLTKKISDEIGGNTERLRTLEMVMSDYLDNLRDLNYSFEKHRKGIPDTEDFKPRGKKV